MTNFGSANAIIEVFIHMTSKRVSNVIPWQQEFTCFFVVFLQSGKTDWTFISCCGSLPPFQPDHCYSRWNLREKNVNTKHRRSETLTQAIVQRVDIFLPGLTEKLSAFRRSRCDVSDVCLLRIRSSGCFSFAFSQLSR